MCADKMFNNLSILKIIFKSFWRLHNFIFHEFKSFFSLPKSSLSKNFWLTTRNRVNSMGLWCSVGIAIIHLIFYIIMISDPDNLPNFDIQLESQGPMIALQNFNYRVAQKFQELGFHIINIVLFTLFLIFWLYIHYAQGRCTSKKTSLLLCIVYIIANNLETITSFAISPAFADIWLIMAPIIIVPSVGTRSSLPLLLINLALHHTVVNHQLGPHNILISIVSLFLTLFIMMIQMEYYRREMRLHEAIYRLRERALEIELIKENMNSGLMLLNLELKIRPNFSDICVKMLHKKDLREKYFPKLLRNIVEENQCFINSMNYGNDPEEESNYIHDLDEWEKRIEHYFEMLKTEQLNDEELACIDPLKMIKIYSYEGRSYISFHVSTVKVHSEIQYFMILISDDTGKVAGRYKIIEYERKHLERAQLLFTLLSRENPIKQLELFNSFAKNYLELSQKVLTEVRSTIPPIQLVEDVTPKLTTMQNIFHNFNLHKYHERATELLKKCHNFSQIEPEHCNNLMIINKSIQNLYIQLIVNCELFLHETRSLFSIATSFIREPRLAEELQKQKQALHYGLSQDTLQSTSDTKFYETQLNKESQIFINLYTAFEILLSQHNLQHDLELAEKNFFQKTNT